MCSRLKSAVMLSMTSSPAPYFGVGTPGHPTQPRSPRTTGAAPSGEDAHTVRLGGVAYELGEHDMSYADMPGLRATLARHGLHDEPELWGFGRYRRTRREPADLAIACAQKTLAASGVAAQDVDAVVLCSVVFPCDVRAQRALTHRILSGLQMETTPLLGVSMSRCATLTGGIRLADDLLASRRYRTILVLSCDAVSDESERFEPFAIFSDAAASCLLSSSTIQGYELVHTVQASRATAADSDGPDAGGRLAASANLQLGEAHVAPRSLHKVFHDNLFRPIVSLREQMAGFDSKQLFMDNISAIGHCFGCDPLINLADFCAATTPAQGTLLGLFSGTPGVRTGIVLRVPGSPTRH